MALWNIYFIFNWPRFKRFFSFSSILKKIPAQPFSALASPAAYSKCGLQRVLLTLPFYNLIKAMMRKWLLDCRC